MKKKVLSIISIILIVGAIGLIIMTYLQQHKKAQNYTGQIISFVLPQNWQVTENKTDFILLTHETGASVEIKLIKLDRQQQASTLNTLVNNVKTDLKQTNSQAQLIIKNDTQLLKNNLPATQLVYETATTQSLVEITKTNQYLIVINYSAPNNYFDILLNSYRAMENSINLVNPDYNLAYKAITTSGITFAEGTDNKYQPTQSFIINNNHYEVEYELPKICDLTNFDSMIGYHKCDPITITVSNEYQNLATMLNDQTAYGSVAYEINYLKNSSDYDQLVVTNDQITNGYRYKLTYQSKDHKKTYEVLYILTELDYLRTNVIKVSAENKELTTDLISKIKINKTTKYGWNIDKTENNGLLQGQLQEYVNSYEEPREYYTVTYLIPKKYEEQDYEQNKYLYRYFQYEYDALKDDYNYDISIELNRYSDSLEAAANIESDYQEFGDYHITKIMDINNWAYYSGSYVEDSKTYYEAYLFQDLSKGGYLKVSFRSNVKPIPQEVAQDFTNMQIIVSIEGA